MEEVGFEVRGKKQGRSSKALGRFERELILTGVKCQGVVGDKGGEKDTGIRDARGHQGHRGSGQNTGQLDSIVLI